MGGSTVNSEVTSCLELSVLLIMVVKLHLVQSSRTAMLCNTADDYPSTSSDGGEA